MNHIDFPFKIDGRGRTAQTDPDGYIRDLIEQVLFTAPGERVNRPEFGLWLTSASVRAQQRGAGDRNPNPDPRGVTTMAR